MVFESRFCGRPLAFLVDDQNWEPSALEVYLEVAADVRRVIVLQVSRVSPSENDYVQPRTANANR